MRALPPSVVALLATALRLPAAAATARSAATATPRVVPGARLVTYRGASHGSPFQDTVGFARRVARSSG